MVVSACGNITEDDLIGGTWVATSGYIDGETSGTPNCGQLNTGLQFLDEELVYVVGEKRNFEYELREGMEQMEIKFFDPELRERREEKGDEEVETYWYLMGEYFIEKHSNNEFSLEDQWTSIQNPHHCYMERQDSE